MALMRYSEAERLHRLRLWRSHNVGPMTFGYLLNRYGSARRALRELPALLRRSGRDIRPCPEEEVVRELAGVSAFGAEMVFLGEQPYPTRLSVIPDPPPVLTFKGALHLLRRPCIAIVGARNASEAGRVFAGRLARACAEEGFTVISGLARGVDAHVHRAGIAASGAVLAGGLNRPYPRENIPLFDDLCASGIVLSEMAFDQEPRSQHFPRRNRLIAGLCEGTVVVEASRRSGSLITADFALEYGREVFAVPGHPLDPRSAGGNHLIRQGAHIVEKAEDILEVLGGPLARPPAEPVAAGFVAPSPPEAEREIDTERLGNEICTLLGTSAVRIDDLANRLEVSVSQLHRVLCELELEGRLRRLPGGARVSLCHDEEAEEFCGK